MKSKQGKQAGKLSGNTQIRFLVMLSFALAWLVSAAQVAEDKYEKTYRNTPTDGIPIQHKPAKWYQFRESGKTYGDSFDDENPMHAITFDGNEIAIQATHAYVDTIYMHKGSTIGIISPNTLWQSWLEPELQSWMSTTPNYYRWFDYRTNGTFYFDPDNCNDLLTPDATKETNHDLKAWRFKNGYVSGGAMEGGSKLFVDMMFYYPTDAEFAAAKAKNDGFTCIDNAYYVVACDLSAYTDFAETYTSGGKEFGYRAENGDTVYCEPTLSGRLLFYIIGVDDVKDNANPDSQWRKNGHGRLLDAAYQGGRNDEQSKYLEEYVMTYPSHRLSNYTDELVTLSKDADAYAIPDVPFAQDKEELHIRIAEDDNSAGIEIVDEDISGTNRVIHFRKQGTTDKSPWTVPDKSTATILVTKVLGNDTYNIARFKLTFKEETTPLTQHQLVDIGSEEFNDEQDKWWNDLRYRSPNYMKEQLDLITSLEFSYSDEAENVTNNRFNDDENRLFYKFPLKWNECTYAFYDGSNHEENDFADDYNVVRWCSYAIMDGYYGNGENYASTYAIPEVTQGMGKDPDGFFLYVDASDRPGTIVTLPFDENLCQGSELFVSAWMKSSGSRDADDAGVLFTIMGVDKENGTEVPIYRHCSGQIRTTCYLNDDYPGMGAEFNDWFQVYFSFICDDVNYDSYYLKVENYCSSTAGGDFYLDEIKVFVEKPSVRITQLDPTCASDHTLMRMDIDFDTMISRLGKKESDYTEKDGKWASVDFILLNKALYDNYLSDYDGDPTSDEAIIKAIDHAAISIESNDDNPIKFPTLDFMLYYEDNAEYVDGTPNLDYENEWFYKKRRDEYNNRMLSIDFYSALLPYVRYLIILEPHTKISGEYEKEKEFARIINSGCTIETEFNVTSTTLLKINGEIVTPAEIEDLCVGEIVDVSALARYKDIEGEYHLIENQVCFDWFFGTAEELIREEKEYENESVYTALTAFRSVYPDAIALESSYDYYENDEQNKVFDKQNGTYKNTFSLNQYNILSHYVSQKGADGDLNNQLLLHKESVNVYVLPNIHLVCLPIENETVIPEDAVMVCFSYVELTFTASGTAPSLGVGFNNVVYPTVNFIPNMRIGLSQINASSEQYPITVNLRNAQYIDKETVDSGQELPKTDHLGKVSTSKENLIDFTNLFLVDTDDPEYHDRFNENFGQFDIPIGKIKYLFAKDDDSNDDENIGSYMKIFFNTDTESNRFAPKEGCYYTMTVHFEEQDKDGIAIPTSCYGTFPLVMKVVPEYLVWQGKGTDNWNNDGNWRRASAEELRKSSTSDYLDNGENGTDNGFVPMLFSKVVMPENSKSQGYMAGFAPDNNDIGKWSWAGEDAKPMELTAPTDNIMYDLMVFEEQKDVNRTALVTKRYRVNLCNQIHFEPNAELLHSELFLYDNAWIDVAVPKSKWTLVALPLKDVVAGDWYITNQMGREASEYFTEMDFNRGNASRYDPLVYQRSWNSNDAVIVRQDNQTAGTPVPSYASTGWTSVFNDTSVPFTTGKGFSIKSYLPERNEQSDDDMVFRFPKSDTYYACSSMDFSKENSGMLWSSDLVDRTINNPNEDGGDVYENGKESLSVDLSPTSDGYCLVGNPFTACLSMQKFLEVNDNITEYWLETQHELISGSAGLTSMGNADYRLKPCQAFFVKAGTPYYNISVRFTKDMQVLSDDDEIEEQEPSVLSIRAVGSGGESSAAIAYFDTASDEFDADEDAILLKDVSWKSDNLPLVYTVAGSNAVSINKLKDENLIPIGVFADDDSQCTLTFVGVNSLEEPMLYDAQTNVSTPITEGFSMAIAGSSHGRYFIHSSGHTTNGMTDTSNRGSRTTDRDGGMAANEHGTTVFSPTKGTVVVSTSDELRTVEVYSVSGILEKRIAITTPSHAATLENVNSGVAIVKARTAEGEYVRKIIVR